MYDRHDHQGTHHDFFLAKVVVFSVPNDVQRTLQPCGSHQRDHISRDCCTFNLTTQGISTRTSKLEVGTNMNQLVEVLRAVPRLPPQLLRPNCLLGRSAQRDNPLGGSCVGRRRGGSYARERNEGRIGESDDLTEAIQWQHGYIEQSLVLSHIEQRRAESGRESSERAKFARSRLRISLLFVPRLTRLERPSRPCQTQRGGEEELDQ
jgi:hypothetical protein